MSRKLSAPEERVASFMQSIGYTLTEAQLAAVVLAVKGERKAPAVKRDDTEMKEVVQEFCKASGLVQPPELFGKPSTWIAINWLAPVTRIIQQCNGKSKVAIVEGVKANRLARLTISSPKSVEATAKDWHAKQVGAEQPQSLTTTRALL